MRDCPLASGRSFTEQDIKGASKVCLLGQTIVESLFRDMDPVGRIIRIKKLPFTVIEALTLSLTGGVTGIILGLAGSRILSMPAGWSTIVSPLSIILAFSFSGLVRIFFGFYPAYKTSLLNPIEALRYE